MQYIVRGLHTLGRYSWHMLQIDRPPCVTLVAHPTCSCKQRMRPPGGPCPSMGEEEGARRPYVWCGMDGSCLAGVAVAWLA
eukprot:scaffold196179_cov46-Tisochrysis_lutea.AAC.1